MRLPSIESRAWWLLPLVAASLAVVLLGLLVEPVLQNGDAAVYNEQIERRALDGRTTHWGYFALGIAFRALLPGETDLVMNLMTLVFGVLGAGAVYFASLKISGCWPASTLAALSVLSIPIYLRGSLMSEVDVPLAALLAVAYCLALHESALGSGLVFGVAMLVSPLAALVLPAVLAVLIFENPTSRRARFVRVARFAAVSLLVYVPVVLTHWHDYLHGGRGVFHAGRERYNVLAQSSRSLRLFREQCSPLLPFWLLGMVVSVLRKRFALVAAPLLSGIATALFGDRFSDVPAQLPTALIFSPLVAMGLVIAQRPARWVAALGAVAAVAWNAFDAQDTARNQIATLMRERRIYLQIKESNPAPLLVNLRSFQEKVRAERIVFGRTYSERAFSDREFKRQCRRLASSRTPSTIWFLGSSSRLRCRELDRNYQSTTRRLEGKKYQVFLPKRRHHRR